VTEVDVVVDLVVDLVVGASVIVGSVLVMLAGLGVLRFPDLFSRMHAATKATTLGLGLIGVAAALAVDGVAGRVVVAVAAVFVTAPAAAHMVARATYRPEPRRRSRG